MKQFHKVCRVALAAGGVAALAACSEPAPSAAETPAAAPIAAGLCSPEWLAGLKGLDLAAAQQKVEAAGLRHRVVRDGDKNFPVTLDFDHERVGLELEAGKVVAARCG